MSAPDCEGVTIMQRQKYWMKSDEAPWCAVDVAIEPVRIIARGIDPGAPVFMRERMRWQRAAVCAASTQYRRVSVLRLCHVRAAIH
jgi:hypothetical protein